MGDLLTAQGLKRDPNKVEVILQQETRKTKEDRELDWMVLLTIFPNFSQDSLKSWSYLGDTSRQE